MVCTCASSLSDTLEKMKTIMTKEISVIEHMINVATSAAFEEFDIYEFFFYFYATFCFLDDSTSFENLTLSSSALTL